tara:strand:+ start:771 stop:1094 length:324 start_codon:yes stop_codon:yes gene_type:complete
MNITLKLDNNYKYLQFWNSIFNLTSKELTVLTVFMDLNDNNNLCSYDNKVKVANELKIDDPNKLNNYVKKFKDKGAIIFKKNKYVLHKLLKEKGTVSVKVVRGSSKK